MEEDVLGPRQTLGKRYTTCSRCGQVVPRQVTHPKEAGVLESTHSAVAELCPACEKLELSEPLPIVDPDE
jgi:hypothetical protein